MKNHRGYEVILAICYTESMNAARISFISGMIHFALAAYYLRITYRIYELIYTKGAKLATALDHTPFIILATSALINFMFWHRIGEESYNLHRKHTVLMISLVLGATPLIILYVTGEISVFRTYLGIVNNNK